MADDDFTDLHDIETPVERRIADIIDADTIRRVIVRAESTFRGANSGLVPGGFDIAA